MSEEKTTGKLPWGRGSPGYKRFSVFEETLDNKKAV